MAQVKENPWVRWQEVQQFFGCSRAMAYRIIQNLNKELEGQGFLVYAGRVSRKYFRERYYA